jgi:hypothetical protein
MAGFLITKTKKSEFLEGKISKLGRNTNPEKYYPEAGPARREGKLPLRGQTGFGNPATGVIPGGFIPNDPGPAPSVVDYLVTEVNDQMITEDGNNIILE